ncbi:hypothetical protein GCM10009864_04700 [Streptomyces lunalinharesii]|uniref:Coproporphyrinogen III oxidase n=1 Tax=Streptomyces lunalinharesii TaxID=333384 RepID=A0ABN3R7A8_9ACTN
MVDGQTERSWRRSLDAALRWRPEELCLYPLYVRPLTGLGRTEGAGPDPEWDAQRLRLYRHGRDHLLTANDFPTELAAFAERGWLDETAGPDLLRLSPEGLAHSDALGPMLFSPGVRSRMAAYDLK